MTEKAPVKITANGFGKRDCPVGEEVNNVSTDAALQKVLKVISFAFEKRSNLEKEREREKIDQIMIYNYKICL